MKLTQTVVKMVERLDWFHIKSDEGLNSYILGLPDLTEYVTTLRVSCFASWVVKIYSWHDWLSLFHSDSSSDHLIVR